MRPRLWASPCTILLLLAAGGCATSLPTIRHPTSREAKVLLEGSRFANREQAFRSYWDLVLEVAAAQGVKVRSRYRGFKEKRRRIVFIDTKDFAMRKHGYVLRRRRKLKGGVPKNKVEFAVKYRSRKMAEAAAAPTEAPDHFSSTEFEEDMGFDSKASDGLKRIYAKRTKFKTLPRKVATVADCSELFPVLGRLGIPPQTAVEVVNGIEIEEWRVQPGRLDFGGRVVASPDITLWCDKAGKPLIGEFSFDHRIRQWPEGGEANKLFAFYHALRKASAEWLARGSTKTAFTYGARSKQGSTP